MSDWDQRWHRTLEGQHRRLFDYGKKGIREEYAAHVACPVCGADDAALFVEKDWFRFVRCRRCEMVYLNPRFTDEATYQFYNSDANAIYNESKFEDASGSRAFDYAANEEDLDFLDRRRGGKRGRVLEIGSAKGNFLERAKARGYEVYGLELNKKNWEDSRSRLGDTMLNVDLLQAGFPPAYFDVIYLRDLIQHIPDPKKLLAECFRVAVPGATIFIGTHNVDGLIERAVKGRYTTFFGFMEPNHFSPKTLGRLLTEVGFSGVKVQFKSVDFTLSEIVRHFQGPTFTTIRREYPGTAAKILLRAVQAALVRWPLRPLDRKLTPLIANALRRGSWMNVTATKS
jgi:SAM-dependent methyltransferase